MGGYSFGVDAWSLGALVFQTASGAPPFAAKTYEETCRRILSSAPCFPEFITAPCRDFLGRLLQGDPARRLLLEEATGHAWLSSLPWEGPGGGALSDGHVQKA